MKTVYFGHARSFDYKNEWYKPIQDLNLGSEIEILFPHDVVGENRSTKELFQKGCDLFVVEVSYPSTGLGIELGYADMLHIPIICFYKTGSKVSDSLKRLTSDSFFEYSDKSDLQQKLRDILSVI